MTDKSYLDKKYFIDDNVYNCPFCNRGNVQYYLGFFSQFSWTKDKLCNIYIVTCGSCSKKSMHLSFDFIHESLGRGYSFTKNLDIDSKIFYSVPSSFFVVDNRLPNILRELITEAEECLKMNFLTGASACMRKAIYELLVKEQCSETRYDDRIKELKVKHKDIDPSLFDILGHIQNMTSDKIHEQSWDKWDSGSLKLIIETLKAILHEIYVTPAIRAERLKSVLELKQKVEGSKNKNVLPKKT
jgi:hypothetical protein